MYYIVHRSSWILDCISLGNLSEEGASGASSLKCLNIGYFAFRRAKGSERKREEVILLQKQLNILPIMLHRSSSALGYALDARRYSPDGWHGDR